MLKNNLLCHFWDVQMVALSADCNGFVIGFVASAASKISLCSVTVDTFTTAFCWRHLIIVGWTLWWGHRDAWPPSPQGGCWFHFTPCIWFDFWLSRKHTHVNVSVCRCFQHVPLVGVQSFIQWIVQVLHGVSAEKTRWIYIIVATDSIHFVSVIA